MSKLLIGGGLLYAAIGVVLEASRFRRQRSACEDSIAQANRQNAREPGSGGVGSCHYVGFSPTYALLWPITFTPLAFVAANSRVFNAIPRLDVGGATLRNT